MLKSTKVKYFGITGTVILIALSYTLSANTFYKEINQKSISKPTVKKVEALTISPKKLTAKKVVVSEKILPTPVTAYEKVQTLLKENKYIRFDKNGNISPTSKKVLAKLTPLFASIDNVYIEIEGYSISLKTAEKAHKKSLAFAEKVYDYLKKKDIDKKLELTGYGDTYPICDNMYDDKNSRVELKIRRR